MKSRNSQQYQKLIGLIKQDKEKWYYERNKYLERIKKDTSKEDFPPTKFKSKPNSTTLHIKNNELIKKHIRDKNCIRHQIRKKNLIQGNLFSHIFSINALHYGNTNNTKYKTP